MLGSRRTCPRFTPLCHLARSHPRLRRQWRDKHTLFTTPSGTYKVCFAATFLLSERRASCSTAPNWSDYSGPAPLGLRGHFFFFFVKPHALVPFFKKKKKLTIEVRSPADVWVYILIIVFFFPYLIPLTSLCTQCYKTRLYDTRKDKQQLRSNHSPPSPVYLRLLLQSQHENVWPQHCIIQDHNVLHCIRGIS